MDDDAIDEDLQNVSLIQKAESIMSEETVMYRTSGKMTRQLVLLTFLSAIGGFLFGYDTGVVSGAMLFVRQEFHLDSLWQELVVSVTIGAAALFSLIGGCLNDRFGRKPVILLASIVFTIGAMILGLARSKNLLLGGRIVVGAGIGMAAMTVPVYIAECAPAHMRGKLIVLNNLFITGGQFAACLIDGAFNNDHVNGWRFMLGLAGIPSVIQLCGFLFMPESPRWLVSRNRCAEARLTLIHMRGGESVDVDDEMAAIQSAHQEYQRLIQYEEKRFVVMKMLRTASTRRALFVGCGMQLFQQLVGINTIMYYSATIIQMSGIREAGIAVWLAAATSAVNFFFTFVGIYLVERIGRRSLALLSLSGTFCGLLLLAVSFFLAANHSPRVTMNESASAAAANASFINPCTSFQTCDACVTSSSCGFCYLPQGYQSAINASCVPSLKEELNQVAEWGRCSTRDSPQFVWSKDLCPSAFSWMSFLGLVIYLMFFAPGMGPVPWTINAEIYPLWARSTGMSLSTSVNWLCNLLISMTFLTLTETITHYGTFALYATLCLLAIVFVAKFVPETKGKTLEQIQHLWLK